MEGLADIEAAQLMQSAPGRLAEVLYLNRHFAAFR